MTDVSGILDTSVIVRYLTGRPRHAAEAARAIVEAAHANAVPLVGLVEAAYVLTTVYRVPRDATADALAALVQQENIVVLGSDKEYVILGLRMCRPSGRVSFGDAMIWAAARSSGIETLYTFDERFPPAGLDLRSTVRASR